MKKLNYIKSVFVSAFLTMSGSVAAETIERSLCVFDVVGANGDTYTMMRNYALAAKQWGVNFTMKPYTDESLVKADFMSGKCDAMELFGIRNREVVRFAGSLDMMAALPSYDAMRTAVAAMSSPRAAELMREGPYETVGVIPGGKVYLFSSDRNKLADWEDLAGQKITIISEDEQAIEMVQYMGATVLPASVSTFAGMFNSGSADVSYAPAFAYKALEMYKGLGDKGGILNYNLGILSFQINIHHERFAEGFGQKSREWVLDNMWNHGMRIIEQAEAEIPNDYWVELDTEKNRKYNEMFSNVRQQLWDGDKVYSRRMQKMLKQIRCRELPSNAECTQDSEGGPAI